RGLPAPRDRAGAAHLPVAAREVDGLAHLLPVHERRVRRGDHEVGLLEVAIGLVEERPREVEERAGTLLVLRRRELHAGLCHAALQCDSYHGTMEEATGYHMTPEEFRRQGHAVVDWIARYWEEVERYPVLSQVAPGDVRRRLPPRPPERGEPFEEMM